VSRAERWSRPRKLRRVLAGALVLATIASVLLVGGLNWVAARRLLSEGTQQQLVSVGESRARSLEAGVERLLAQVSAVAADLAVVEALDRLDEAFAELDQESLTPTQDAELDEYYEANVIGPINDAGLGPVTLADSGPPPSARYLQYHYTATQPPDERAAVTDPGDGSAYSDVHAEVHPFLLEVAAALNVEDLLLIDAAGPEIVYSIDKRIDLGTPLDGALHDDTALAETILEDLGRVRTGDAVLGDYQIYVPADGRPVLFAAAAVRSNTEVIGAIAVEIPAERLSALTTGSGDFEAIGLSEGENYVVSSSGQVLQSESRLWIEDPDAYLAKTDDETAELVELFGSPVGIQQVDTEAVRAAIDGMVFEGATKNYLGMETFTHATPVDIEGTNWVAVTEVDQSDARAPLLAYGLRLGLVMLITIPIAGLIGIWLADRITRPIPPVLAAAEAVAEGERDPDLPDLGRDEFGDLSRRLGTMAADLAQREQELDDEFERTRALLLSVLPPRIVDPDGEVSSDTEMVDIVTVVSIDVVLQGEPAEHIDTLNRLRDTAEAMAVERSLDRVRAAADRLLLLIGAGKDDDGAAAAIDFARDLLTEARRVAEDDGVDVAFKMGLSTGPVGTGVLQRGSLTYGAWGEPVRRALAIGALSGTDEVLIDESTRLAAGVDLPLADDVVALDGQDMSLYVLGADG